MSRKVCRRRHYPLINPITMAIEGASITPDNLLDRLRLLELSALESFTTGRATIEDWKSIADVLNVAETMARAGVGPEVLEVCQRVEAGLDESRDRHRRTGKMGLSGPAIQAVRDLIEYHDIQRTSVSRGKYEALIQKTRDRIRSAHPDLKRTVT